MNSIMTGYWPTFRLYQALRDQLMQILGDDDLAFDLGGETEPLGVLCRQIGETEQDYINSFRTFRIDFSTRNTTPGLQTSVRALGDWYAALDRDLQAVIEGLSEDDIGQRVIDRGSFTLPPAIHLDVYKEALLIFYGKVSVYLKAMGRPRPEQWAEWIA